MTDLVSQLVGALEKLALAVDAAEDGCTDGGFSTGYENGHGIECGSLLEIARAEARAALTAAKAGGWVAVPERTTGDAFENAIRRYGVVAACEWFGHAPDSEFTKETQRVLDERLQPLPAPPAQRGEG